MLQPIVALLVIKCDPDFNDMGNEWYRTRSSTFRYTSSDRFITLWLYAREATSDY